MNLQQTPENRPTSCHVGYVSRYVGIGVKKPARCGLLARMAMIQYMFTIDKDDSGKWLTYLVLSGIAVPVSDSRWRTQAAAVYEATRILEVPLQ